MTLIRKSWTERRSFYEERSCCSCHCTLTSFLYLEHLVPMFLPLQVGIGKWDRLKQFEPVESAIQIDRRPTWDQVVMDVHLPLPGLHSPTTLPPGQADSHQLNHAT